MVRSLTRPHSPYVSEICTATDKPKYSHYNLFNTFLATILQIDRYTIASASIHPSPGQWQGSAVFRHIVFYCYYYYLHQSSQHLSAFLIGSNTSCTTFLEVSNGTNNNNTFYKLTTLTASDACCHGKEKMIVQLLTDDTRQHLNRVRFQCVET